MDEGGRGSEATSVNLMERLRVDSPSPEGTSATLNAVQHVRRTVRFRNIDSIPSPEQIQNPTISPLMPERLPDSESRRWLEDRRARLDEEIHVLEAQYSNLRSLREVPATLVPSSWDTYNAVFASNLDEVATVWGEWETMYGAQDGHNT